MNIESSLDAQALRFLTTKGRSGVSELYDALRVKDSSVSREEVTNLVWRLEKQDKVELEDAPQLARSFVQYLGRWERNLWLYVSLSISLLAVISVYALPSEFPYVAIRWVLGSVFVILIPGYVLTEVLFPRNGDLGLVERLALSVGLSLALVPLVGLLLNYTVWGIRLAPVLVSLVIFAFAMSAGALFRHYEIETGT